jgi:hypothetical protein
LYIDEHNFSSDIMFLCLSIMIVIENMVALWIIKKGKMCRIRNRILFWASNLPFNIFYENICILELFLRIMMNEWNVYRFEFSEFLELDDANVSAIINVLIALISYFISCFSNCFNSRFFNRSNKLNIKSRILVSYKLLVIKNSVCNTW